MERKEIVRYWVESSDDDYQVMQSLFDNGHYAWALFLSHLVIEKLLKACHVKYVDVNYPRIHNLVEIAVKANLDELVKSQKCPRIVIPVKTGIQRFQRVTKTLDTGFHRCDDF
jgi:HEPN domain-containing protein